MRCTELAANAYLPPPCCLAQAPHDKVMTSGSVAQAPPRTRTKGLSGHWAVSRSPMPSLAGIQGFFHGVVQILGFPQKSHGGYWFILVYHHFPRKKCCFGVWWLLYIIILLLCIIGLTHNRPVKASVLPPAMGYCCWIASVPWGFRGSGHWLQPHQTLQLERSWNCAVHDVHEHKMIGHRSIMEYQSSIVLAQKLRTGPSDQVATRVHSMPPWL